MAYFSRLCRFSIFTIFFLIVISCNNTVNDSPAPDNSTSEVAHIRIIHSASSTSELDFTYRDISTNNFYILQEDAVYGHQYGYFDLYTGEREIKFYLSNSQIAVTGITLSLVKDQKYTLMAYDYEATVNPEILSLRDTLAVPEQGMSYIRFIHTGTDVSNIRIVNIENSENVADLSRLQNSKYLKMPAQTYHFQVITSPSNEVLVEDVPVTLLSEQIYSIVFSGSVSGITAIDFNAKIYRETSL
jgi:hypothetical protein